MGWCAYPSRTNTHKGDEFGKADLHPTDLEFLKTFPILGGDEYITSWLKYLLIMVSVNPDKEWIEPEELGDIAQKLNQVIRYIGEWRLRDWNDHDEIIAGRDICIAFCNRGLGLLVSY